jgi:TP901 family phage tail tape measure protein
MQNLEQIGLELIVSAKNLAEGPLKELRSTLESIAKVASSTFKEMALAERGVAANIKPVEAGMKAVATEMNLVGKMATEMGTKTKATAREIESSFKPVATEMNSVGKSISTMGREANTSFRIVAQEMNTVGKAASTMGARTAIAGKEASSAGKRMHEFFNNADAMIAGTQLQMWGQQMLHFFGAAVHAATDFDQNIHNVVASLVAMGDHTMRPEKAFETLKKKALELGMSGYFSANKIGEAMNTMAAQGISAKQILSGAIQEVSLVAAANQQDLEHTANVMSDIIHQMGSELKTEFGGSFQHQMQGVGDAMTKALHNGRMSMEDFLSVMRYAGPQAANMGVSFKDLAGSIAELARHGIKGSQAGTILRRMFTNLVPMTKAAKAAFVELGFTTKENGNIFLDAAGKLKPLAEVQQILHDHIGKLTPAMQQMAIKTIFGQYALSGMTAIVKEAPTEFSRLLKSMGQTGVTAEALAEKSKGLGLQTQKMKAHWDTFMKEVGDALKPLMLSLISVVNSLFEVWQKIPTPIKDTIVQFAAIAAVGATLIGSFMLLGSTISMFISSLGPVLAYLPVVRAAFTLGPTLAESGAAIIALTGPIGWIVGAVVLAATLIIANWKKVASWVHEIFGISLPTTMKGWGQVFSSTWHSIERTFQKVWNYVGPTIHKGVKEISKVWNQAWPHISRIFGVAMKVIEVDFKLMSVPLVAGIGFIVGAWNKGWKTMGSFLKLEWHLFVTVVKTSWHLISGVVKVGLDLLRGNWNKAWGDLKTTVHNVWKDLTGGFKKLLGDAASFGSNFAGMIASGINGAIGGVRSAVSNIISTISSTLSGGSTSLAAHASHLASTISGSMRSQLKINSPSLVMKEIGESVGEGLALGMQSSIPGVSGQASNLAGAAIPSLGMTPNLSYNATSNSAGLYSQSSAPIQIIIQGGTVQTNEQLADMITRKISKRFRTQMVVATPM